MSETKCYVCGNGGEKLRTKWFTRLDEKRIQLCSECFQHLDEMDVLLKTEHGGYV